MEKFSKRLKEIGRIAVRKRVEESVFFRAESAEEQASRDYSRGFCGSFSGKTM